VRIPLDLGARTGGIWAVVPDHLGASERSDGLRGRVLDRGCVAVGVAVGLISGRRV
jgi:hypothetical protein